MKLGTLGRLRAHFRLILNSTGKLKFSYGAMKGRPEARFGQQLVTSLPPLMERLRAAGFGAVVMASWAYAPDTINQVGDSGRREPRNPAGHSF